LPERRDADRLPALKVETTVDFAGVCCRVVCLLLRRPAPGTGQKKAAVKQPPCFRVKYRYPINFDKGKNPIPSNRWISNGGFPVVHG
jgi:hypothetical protein